jgi:putative tributyrin esterase
MSEFAINLKSSILSGPTDLSVIVPSPQGGGSPKEFYGAQKKYKVLWLLHAGKGDRNDWLRNTTLSRMISEREVIAVIPNALNSDFANHPHFAHGYNFSDFFFEELMPFIYNWFPASDDPKDNFLAGVSMGGAATWMYGLQHPEKFAAIAPLSSAPKTYSFLEPYRAFTAAEFTTKATADPRAFPAQSGNPDDGLHVKELNMITKYSTVGDFLDSPEHTWDRFVEVAAAGRLPRIYLPCGTSCGPTDKSSERVFTFKDGADKLGVCDIVYDFIPSYGHNFEFWQHILPKVLDFFRI